MSARTEVERLNRKFTDQTGVEKPDNSVITQNGVRERCWALKRSRTNSLLATWLNCEKPARPGHLTCHFHADREEAAQNLKRGSS